MKKRAFLLLLASCASCWVARPLCQPELASASAEKIVPVRSWRDIFKAYQEGAVGQTVVAQLQTDIEPSADFLKGCPIVPGKNLTIEGNGHRLMTAGPNASSTIGQAGFYSQEGQVAANTVLKVSHVRWENAVSGGLFQARGAAKPTFIYDYVQESNQQVAAVTPIRNDQGQVRLTGQNRFNISQPDANAKPEAAAWITGARDVVIVSGQTVVQQQTPAGQPLCLTGDQGNLTLEQGARLSWQLDQANSLVNMQGQSPKLNWRLAEATSFTINGGADTARAGWFRGDQGYASWDLNLAEQAQLQANLAGGLVTKHHQTRWHLADQAKLRLKKTGTNQSGLINGGFGRPNFWARELAQVTLAKTSTLELANSAGPVFTGISTALDENIQFNLQKGGSYVTQEGPNAPTQATSSIGIVAATFIDSDGQPAHSHYVRFNQAPPAPARYLRFDQTSVFGRTFRLQPADFQSKTGHSPLIGGQQGMQLAVATNQERPSFTVKAAVQQPQSALAGLTKYFWRQAPQGSSQPLGTQPKTLWSVQAGQPSANVSQQADQQGQRYQSSYGLNEGLLLQAKDGIRPQKEPYQGAVIDYTLEQSPQN
ncbi:hypothetical protein PT274_02635 [Leuconostocaceae bacterium ESL0958]|nr:hypothetical protein [Leuconostocaceae bacterium ESL0958]